MVEGIESLFPGLQLSPFRITSPTTAEYNCVAWAAGDTQRWWWPDPDPDNQAVFWPSGAPKEETVDAFVAAFATLGYAPALDKHSAPGYEKVALFALGMVPTHAARQVSNGRWTSKLGKREDIEHDLHALRGDVYGNVVLILERTIARSA